MAGDTILPIIAGVVGGGGGITALVTFLLGRKGSKRDDFKTILDGQEALAEARRRDADEQRAVNGELRAKVVLLEHKIEILEIDRDDMPIPVWFVDRDGHYLSVNARFVRELLIPRGMTEAQVLGKTHGEVWSDDTAARLHSLDLAAMRAIDGRARLDNVVLEGVDGTWTIFKGPTMKGRTLVGFTGIATPHIS